MGARGRRERTSTTGTRLSARPCRGPGAEVPPPAQGGGTALPLAQTVLRLQGLRLGGPAQGGHMGGPGCRHTCTRLGRACPEWARHSPTHHCRREAQGGAQSFPPPRSGRGRCRSGTLGAWKQARGAGGCWVRGVRGPWGPRPHAHPAQAPAPGQPSTHTANQRVCARACPGGWPSGAVAGMTDCPCRPRPL